jgi:phosphoglycolate phosphatase
VTQPTSQQEPEFKTGPTSQSAQAATEYVLLFDIDGTLIDSGGAGGRALIRAGREYFSCQAIDRVPFHGRTDRGIMIEMLENAGIESTEDNLYGLSQHYFSILPTELKSQGGNVLPGVVDLLDHLAQIEWCHLGLLTGNMAQSAKLKLEHFGLWDYFQFGVYGHAASKRHELSDPAWHTIRQRTEPPGERVVIIGDTEMDVELALTMQVRCLGVCTGGSTADQLLSAGADWVTDDLASTNEVLQWLLPPLRARG